MGVKVTTNKSLIKKRITDGLNTMIAPLTQQVIKDSNYYCRQDQGTLIASSQMASEPERGLAVWDTPYAKKAYYTGTPSHDVNANAELMWCEKAKSEHQGDWDDAAQANFERGMK